jgi:hypothetical protein
LQSVTSAASIQAPASDASSNVASTLASSFASNVASVAASLVLGTSEHPAVSVQAASVEPKRQLATATIRTGDLRGSM